MAAAVSTQTRLGRELLFLGGLVNGQPPTTVETLLEVNLGELSKQLSPNELGSAGSWVFMVDIEPRWAPPPGGTFPVNPLKLRFSMGSGGTRHILEIDAVGGAALQIPTATCRVDVFWDRLPDTIGALPAFEIPASVVVRGTIQRANIVPNARRSILLARSAAAPATTNGLIPPYSYDWMVYSLQTSNVYAAASSNVFSCSSPAITNITLLTGPQMLAALVTGARFPVPPMADLWQIVHGVAANTVVLVDFGVGF